MAYHNWRRPLPRPIVIEVMTLETLEDVRALVHRHLPAEYRSKQTWERVASITTAAARGELPADEVAVALKLVALDGGNSLPVTAVPLPAALVCRGTPGGKSFIIRDANGQALAYLYFEDEPQRQMSMKRLSRDEARRIAANIAKLPDLLRKS